MNREYKRKCPSCEKEIVYSSASSYCRCKKRNTVCNSCAKTGTKNPYYGKPTPISGMKMSAAICKKLSDIRKGKPNGKLGTLHSIEARLKMSIWHTGKVCSEEHKKNIRISKLKRLEQLGIAPCIDNGANQFFEEINKTGFNFKPKKFMELGYVSDGYDSEKHIWHEFDSPYHNHPYQQKKDLIRQNNIIKHFEHVGNPLNLFLRTNADKNGKPLKTKCVYSKPT